VICVCAKKKLHCFLKIKHLYKNLSRSDKFEKIDVATNRFFSDKIKRKKLIALEFACITHEIKLLN